MDSAPTFIWVRDPKKRLHKFTQRVRVEFVPDKSCGLEFKDVEVVDEYAASEVDEQMLCERCRDVL